MQSFKYQNQFEVAKQGSIKISQNKQIAAVCQCR